MQSKKQSFKSVMSILMLTLLFIKCNGQTPNQPTVQSKLDSLSMYLKKYERQKNWGYWLSFGGMGIAVLDGTDGNISAWTWIGGGSAIIGVICTI